MMLYFKSRTKLRQYKGKGEKKDLGNNHSSGKRWAIDLKSKSSNTTF